MHNSNVPIGAHCWALITELGISKLLIVLKQSEDEYSVCGEWECLVAADDLTILQIIVKPSAHDDTPLYYGD